jgi:hypothetical protein
MRAARDRTYARVTVAALADRSPEEADVMSTADAQRTGGTVRQYPEQSSYAYEDSAGSGWVLFAGTMLIMLSVLNGIDGIAAVSNSKFFTQNATYILSDLNTWGWVLIAIATVQGLTGIGVWLQVKGVRWIGVAIAGLNAIVQLVFIPAYPFWSLALFTLDILVIYGLVAHGARTRAA